MATALGNEARNIQNIALGSLLIWRFCVTYERSHKERQSPPFQLIALVLPILLTEDLLQQISSTQEASGLRMFAGKLASSNISKSDMLFSLQRKAEDFKEITLSSLSLAIKSKLLFIQPTTARVMPLSGSEAIVGISNSVRQLQKQAEKIGVWFSQLSLHEISTSLKVGF